MKKSLLFHSLSLLLALSMITGSVLAPAIPANADELSVETEISADDSRVLTNEQIPEGQSGEGSEETVLLKGTGEQQEGTITETDPELPEEPGEETVQEEGTQTEEISAVSMDAWEAVIEKDDVSIRTNAGTQFEPIGTLNNGQRITVTGYASDAEGYTWYRIETEDQSGFVREDMLVAAEVTEDLEEEGGSDLGEDIPVETDQITEEGQQPEPLPEEKTVLDEETSPKPDSVTEEAKSDQADKDELVEETIIEVSEDKETETFLQDSLGNKKAASLASSNAAKASYTILNNGLEGINIDINASPYTDSQYASVRYQSSGCTWFAHARVRQLGYKFTTNYQAGSYYYYHASELGYSVAGPNADISTINTPAILCWNQHENQWDGHVAILEKKLPDGSVIVSQGGDTSAGASHGYASIRKYTVAQMKNINTSGAGFMGYVLLNGGGGTPSYDISYSNCRIDFVDQYNVGPRATINNPSGTTIDYVRCSIYQTSNNQLIALHEERCGVSSTSFEQWHNCWGDFAESEWKNAEKHLVPGTSYYYVLSAHAADGWHDSSRYTFTTTPAAVTGVSLNKTSMKLVMSKTETLTATVAPSDATNKSVIWKSSNTNVAAVSSTGVVTAKAAGTATITVTTTDQGKTATCTVTVVKPSISYTNLKYDFIDAHNIGPHGTIKNPDTVKIDQIKCSIFYKDGTLIVEHIENSGMSSASFDQWHNASADFPKSEWKIAVANLFPGMEYYYVLSAHAADGWHNSAKYSFKTPFSGSDMPHAAMYDPVGGEGTVYIRGWAFDVDDYSANLQIKLYVGGDADSGASCYTVQQNGVPYPTVETKIHPGVGANHGFNHTITVKERGTQTVYVYVMDIGSQQASNKRMGPYTVTINDPPVQHVTGVTLNKTATTLKAGKTETLTATVSPSNATNKGVTWSSSNTSVATVSSSGVVTAKAAGTATITVKTADGGKTATCKVTVPSTTVAVTGVSLNKASLSLKKGASGKLIATIAPSNATNKSVTWKSSKTSVATVSSDGTVKAVAKGTATITVTSADGGKTAKCTVTVTDGSTPAPTPTVKNGWYRENGKDYWYENNVKQGTYSDKKGVIGDGTVRGREIYDPDSKAWYWLDAAYGGAKAVGKEVWMPYIYQDEDKWYPEVKKMIAQESDPGMADCVYKAMINKTGKWVRYDQNGRMLKGWVTITGELARIYPSQAGNVYYYDSRTGLMAKGEVTLNGITYRFDEVTGALIGSRS